MKKIYDAFKNSKFPMGNRDWIYKADITDGETITAMTEFDPDGKELFSQSDIDKALAKDENNYIVASGFLNNNSFIKFDCSGHLIDTYYSDPIKIRLFDFVLKDISTNEVYPLVTECIFGDYQGLKGDADATRNFFQSKIFSTVITGGISSTININAYKFGYTTYIVLNDGTKVDVTITAILSKHEINKFCIDGNKDIANDFYLTTLSGANLLIYADLPFKYKDQLKLLASAYEHKCDKGEWFDTEDSISLKCVIGKK